MEGCGLLYEEWRSGRRWSRLGRMAVVFLLLGMTVLGIREPQSQIYPGRTGTTAGTGGLLAGENGLFSSIELPEAEMGETAVKPAAKAAAPVSEEEAVPMSGNRETAVPEYPDPAGYAEAIPSEPGYPAPGIPETTVPDGQEERIPSVPDETVPSVPDEPIPDENTPEISFPVTVGGFLVNESGFICGIADPSEAAPDGYMELPAEGCSGIAAGAFAAAPAGTMEMYIPANITYIEEGAFIGLYDMEWFEMEPSSGDYYTDNGVLFSDGGTCILGFPAARVGNYKVPSHVTRFAADAFTGARITAVDAADCALTDAGNFPEYIELITEEGLLSGL